MPPTPRRNQARLLPGHPLAGATIVVTRPSATAAALRRRIRAFGGVALSLPGFALHGVADTSAAARQLRSARAADVVIFTSPAAVRFAWRLLPQLRFPRDSVLVAPGAGSARALRRRGVAAPLHPVDRQDSEGVLALPPLQRVRGRRIALVGAAGGRDLLPRELAARGARVTHVDVYRRAPPRLTRRHFDALARAAAPLVVLLSSAEALQHLRAVLPAPLFARLAGADCVASSRRVGEHARTLGFAHVHVARSPAPAALLDAAAGAVAHHRI